MKIKATKKSNLLKVRKIDTAVGNWECTVVNKETGKSLSIVPSVMDVATGFFVGRNTALKTRQLEDHSQLDMDGIRSGEPDYFTFGALLRNLVRVVIDEKHNPSKDIDHHIFQVSGIRMHDIRQIANEQPEMRVIAHRQRVEFIWSIFNSVQFPLKVKTSVNHHREGWIDIRAKKESFQIVLSDNDREILVEDIPTKRYPDDLVREARVLREQLIQFILKEGITLDHELEGEVHPWLWQKGDVIHNLILGSSSLDLFNKYCGPIVVEKPVFANHRLVTVVVYIPINEDMSNKATINVPIDPLSPEDAGYAVAHTLINKFPVKGLHLEKYITMEEKLACWVHTLCNGGELDIAEEVDHDHRVSPTSTL